MTKSMQNLKEIDYHKCRLLDLCNKYILGGYQNQVVNMI